MKVLLMSPLPPPIGGIARWTQIILNSFSNDNECDIVHVDISPRYKGRATTAKRILYGIGNILTTLIKESKGIKRDVNIVHITSSGSFALFRDYFALKFAKKKGISTVYHLHFGRIPEIAENECGEWKMFMKVFQYCDAIIAIDEYTKDVLDSQGFGHKVFIIPNPVDVLKLSKMVIKKKEKKVSYIGHVYSQKGVRELIEAWTSLYNEFSDYSLEIVGSLSGSDLYDALPHNESVLFLGEKTHAETMKLLSESSVMVLPSYSEGFPNVVLEAMALHVPVIATKVGAIPEMLDDGCGVLIESKSTEALQNALNEVLRNKKKREIMAESAFQKVKEYYASDVIVKHYVDIWSRLM